MSSTSWRPWGPLVLSLAGCADLGVSARDVADYADAVASTPTVGELELLLDGLEDTTQVLRVTRADGLDRAGSTLDATLLGVSVPAAPAEVEDAAAAGSLAPRACAIVGAAAVASRGEIGLSEPGAELVGDLACMAMLARVEGLLAEDGDLDAAIEDDLLPAMAATNYTVDSARVEVAIGDVALASRPDGFDLSVELDAVDLFLEEAEVGVWGLTLLEDDLRIGATFDRAEITWSATFDDEEIPYPWPEACGEPLIPHHPPEADEVPRGLVHATIDGTVTGDLAVADLDLDGFGLLTPFVAAELADVGPDLAALLDRTATLPEVDVLFPEMAAAVRALAFVDGASGTTADLEVDVDLDPDGDGLFTGLDDCPYEWDPDQVDSDWDGVGDPCDPAPQPPEGWMWALALQKMDACGLLWLSHALPPAALRAIDPAERRLFDELVRWSQVQGFDWRWLVVDEDPRWPEESPFVYANEGALRLAAVQNLARLGALVRRPDLVQQVALISVPVEPGFVALRVDRPALTARFGPVLAAQIELVVPDRFAVRQ